MTRGSSYDDDAALLADLEAQGAVLKALFHDSGYISVAPPVLQPAEVFLNLSGEDIRRRIYVFTDPGGEELCLRPDLTIPTCRLYLERVPQGRRVARLCYNGAAFRYQKPGSGKPAEFLQAGIELIGARDREAADAEILSLTLKACERAGLEHYEVTLGDVGIFFDLIQALDVPAPWRARLKRYIWQPQEIDTLLRHLPDAPHGGRSGPNGNGGLLHALSRLDEGQARAALSDILDLAQITPVGGRTVDEIAERLLSQAAEARIGALPARYVSLLKAYLKVSGRPAAVLSRLRRLAAKADVDISAALARFERRLDLMGAAGVPVSRLVFDADFGRSLEYYTGFVFEVTVPGLGVNSQIAGGGRYDTLLKRLGAPRDVPAVGGMIRTDRLIMAVKR